MSRRTLEKQILCRGPIRFDPRGAGSLPSRAKIAILHLAITLTTFLGAGLHACETVDEKWFARRRVHLVKVLTPLGIVLEQTVIHAACM